MDAVIEYRCPYFTATENDTNNDGIEKAFFVLVLYGSLKRIMRLKLAIKFAFSSSARDLHLEFYI